MEWQSRAGVREPAFTARTESVPQHGRGVMRRDETGRLWRLRGNRSLLWARLQAHLCRLLRRHRLVVVASDGAAWVLYRCLCCGRVARISRPAGPGTVAEAAMIQRGCPGTAPLLAATAQRLGLWAQDAAGQVDAVLRCPRDR